MEATDFWNRIKAKLAEKGKTQEWLCAQTGMDLQGLRNRIYKNRFPTIEEALKILEPKEITAECELHMGNAEATAWGCDLTYDYVKINADYRS